MNGNGDNGNNGNNGFGEPTYVGERPKRTIWQTQDDLVSQYTTAANQAEAEKLRAQTELEKTRTDYLVEQMKATPGLFPGGDIITVQPVKGAPLAAATLSPLTIIGAALLVWHFSKKGG